MAIALQPKIKRINTHPLKEHRSAAAANGWSQCPALHKKGCFGWPKLACGVADIEALKEWRSEYYAGTAVRVVGKLAVYDADITIPEIADLILEDLYHLDEDAYEKAIVRGSGRVSEAIFWQTATPFAQYKTRSYTAHPELLPELAAAYAMPVNNIEDDADRLALIRDLVKRLDPQKVEIYGPLSRGRFFQYEGPHSPGRDYHCGDRAPWNTHVDDLPMLPMDPALLIDRADAILAQHLTLIPDAPTDAGGDTAYDLTPDTVFYPKDGEPGAISELAGGLEWGAEHGLYGCLPSTVAQSQSMANCKLYVSTAGHVMVLNWAANGRRHYMADDEPAPAFEIPDKLREALRKLQPPQPEPPATPQLAPDATPETALEFLLMHYAFDYHAGKVVKLEATNIEAAHVDLETFHHRYAAYRFPPPRPTVKPTPVSQVWRTHPLRISVVGTRFRPDREFPLYEDRGELFKNAWKQPVHHGDADISWLIGTFFPIFIPDRAEREWYLDVTAHRWIYPAIPGPSVVMVAHGAVSAIGSDYGTGRSGWFDFMATLWGRQYVRNQDFSVVVGQNKQGDFTAWKAFKRLITIDEAKTTPEQTTMKGGNATYELLKTMVDPTPRWRTFNVKFGKPFEEFDYAPMDIASNHQAAVAVPPGDRRFGVISNGRPLTPDEATRFYALINQPGAAAAFARWCERRDLSRFMPYAPPPIFAAKARMQALSETELDVVFAEMAGEFGRMFTKSQARAYAVSRMETTPMGNDVTFDKRFDAAFRHYCTVLREQRDGGLDVRSFRPKTGSSPSPKRERVYTLEARNVALLAGWRAAAIGAEIAKSEAAIKIETLADKFRVINGGKERGGPADKGQGPKTGPEVTN